MGLVNGCPSYPTHEDCTKKQLILSIHSRDVKSEKTHQFPGLFEMSGLAVFPLRGALWMPHVELSVTCRVLKGLDSRLGGRGGGRWAINKGLRGPKKFAEGLRLQLHGEQMEESDADSHWALGPPLSQQSL